MGIPVLSIVGRSGSGKTTLLEKLIPELKGRGYRVAVVKHHPHPGASVDVEGKDTWRFSRAGADHVALVTPDLVMHYRKKEQEPSLTEVVSGIREVDLILTEGFKQERFPKVQVSRGEAAPEPVCDPCELLALVSDQPPHGETPWFDLEDIAGLADLIEGKLLAHRQPSQALRSLPVLTAAVPIEASADQVERWFRALEDHPEQYRFDTHGGFTFTRGRFGEVGAQFQTRERFYGRYFTLNFEVTATGPLWFRFRLLCPPFPIWGAFRIRPVSAGRVWLRLEIGGETRLGRWLLRLPLIRGAVQNQIQAEVEHIRRSVSSL